MPTYVTDVGILSMVGNTNADGPESAWAAACAAAVQAGITARLRGAVIADPSDAFDELKVVALFAGAECYKRKEAIFGVTGHADMQGSAFRVAKDYLEGVRPIINRHASGAGVGIG